MAKKGTGNRIFVGVVVVLLFFGLMFTDLGSFNSHNRTIGTVGDKEITTRQYQIALNNQIRAFEAQEQRPIPMQQALALGIDRAVQARLVTERALDNEAANLGISVGDDRVLEEILRTPAFRGTDGEFDRTAYRGALSRTGQTEATFEAAIRDQGARTLLQGAVVGAVTAPEAYADALVQFIGEQRVITWAAVDETHLTAPLPGATDADLQAYYASNPAPFTAPEQREITYAWVTPDMIQDDLEVSEDDLRRAFEDREAQFNQPERRLVERLVFLDDDAAAAALARVQDGEATFEDLVTERGLALTDADMGDVDRRDLGAAADGVFAATPGDVVGPFATDLGPALFRMNAVLAAQVTTFEEASADLRQELSADRARRQIDTLAEDFNDMLAGGATLEQLAETTQMEVGTLSFDQNSFSGIAAYETFRLAANSVTEDDFPTLENLEDGGVFALRLDAITPPTLRPFDEVADQVRTAWDAEKMRDAINARAAQIAATITPDSNINDTGLLAIAEPSLTRRSFVEGTPPAFMTEVFEMAPGEVRVVPSSRNTLIVRLESIAPPAADDPNTTANRDAVLQSAAAGIAQDIFQAYANTLQTQTDVTLDQAAINAIHAQFQ